MSMQAAMAFLRAVRESEEMRASLCEIGNGEDAMITYAHAHGFEFSAEELDRAFKLDWTARRLHFGRVEKNV